MKQVGSRLEVWTGCFWSWGMLSILPFKSAILMDFFITPSMYWLITSLAFWVPSNAGRTAAADPADDVAGALARAASRDTC